MRVLKLFDGEKAHKNSWTKLSKIMDDYDSGCEKQGQHAVWFDRKFPTRQRDWWSVQRMAAASQGDATARGQRRVTRPQRRDTPEFLETNGNVM